MQWKHVNRNLNRYVNISLVTFVFHIFVEKFSFPLNNNSLEIA